MKQNIKPRGASHLYLRSNRSRTRFPVLALHQPPQTLCGASGGPWGLQAGNAATAELVQLAHLAKSLEDISPGGEASGIFWEKQNSFHIVRSDLCYIKVNFQSQLLVRAKCIVWGSLRGIVFHKDLFIVNQLGAVDLTLWYWSTGFAAIYLPRGKQNSGPICHS